MSRIFISHSSANNALALALAAWLEENGWTDYFLDINPNRGLAPGERWQEALKVAADRCEAVLFLISPAWRDSRWCLAEFILSKQLGKKIFGVIVEPISIDSLPPEMTAEWQLCDVTGGGEQRTFSVSEQPVAPTSTIAFSTSGLARLKVGLQKAGLDPSTFPWPPPHDPQRAPYRGLKALDTDDAAVFFGRDGAVTRGLDALRRVRERDVNALFVILGASGAGKSSYLRAGLWPRLARDDREFLPLPVVRPQGAALTGPTGLVAIADAAYRAARIGRTRADIRGELGADNGLSRIAAGLRALSARTTEGNAPPTVILPIDQAEELFVTEGREESQKFLTLLNAVLTGTSLDGSPGHRGFIAVAAIRSDSYDRLQSHPLLANVVQVPFNLSPMPTAEFKGVITGPAMRASASGRKITVEPALTERLLADAQGPDALPLLAFALERLFVDYGGDGVLSASDYDALGGVRGSIAAAVEAAFADPGRDPAVPRDAASREPLLRRAFIPWLAAIDPETEERRRRVADWNEIPPESRAVIERLVEARLLIRDRRIPEGAAQSVATVEVSHEALLRQWPMLTTWLDEDAESLKVVEAVRRATIEWVRNGRGSAWLIHTGERLTRAVALSSRPDYTALIQSAGAEYLSACRGREDAARADRDAQLARIAAEQTRTVRAQRRARRLLAVIALVLTVFAGWTLAQSRTLARARAHALTIASKDALARDLGDRALRLAVVAMNESPFGAFLPDAEAQLARAAMASRQVLRITLGGTVQAVMSEDGHRVVAFSDNGAARVVDVDTGAQLAIAHDRPVTSAQFSEHGSHIVTMSDKTVRVFDARTGRELARLVHAAAVRAAGISPDGQLVVTALSDHSAPVWDVTTGRILLRLPHASGIIDAGFGMDGHRIVTISEDNSVRIFDTDTGRQLGAVVHDGEILSAAFSVDRQRFATASRDATARVFDLRTGSEAARVTHGDEVQAVDISADGERIVTASQDGTVRVSDARTGKELARVNNLREVEFVAFTHDGQQIISTGTGTVVSEAMSGREVARTSEHFASMMSVSPDGRQFATAEGNTIRVFDTATAGQIAQMTHESDVVTAAFTKDGRRLVTGSRDGTMRLWDVTPAKELARIQHGNFVLGTAFSSDASRFATFDVDGTLAVSDRTGRQVQRYERYGVLSVAFSPDGRWLARGTRSAGALITDVTTGAKIASVGTGGVIAVAFSRDGQQVLATTREGRTQIADARTGHEISHVVHDCTAVVAVLSPDGRRVLVGCTDHSARVSDLNSGKQLARVNHGDALRKVAFLSDGDRILTASDDKTARISDAATGREMCRITHGNHVSSAFASPDESQVVTVSDDQTVRISDARTCDEITRLPRQIGVSTYGAFSPDGRRFALSDGHDNAAVVYDTRTWTEIAALSHDRMVSLLGFSPDGKYLVSGSYGEARVWDIDRLMLDGRQLLQTVCREKLAGARRLLAGDVAAAPLLAGRQDEDVCDQIPWWTRVRASLASLWQ